jgi:hypothetical protein
MERTALTAAAGQHIEKIRGLVEEISTHHRSACDAADVGDDKALNRAHTSLGRCIRSAQVAFANMAKAAMQADSDANKKVQTSAGMGEGTSSKPRTGSPLQMGNAGIPAWLERARQGGRR